MKNLILTLMVLLICSCSNSDRTTDSHESDANELLPADSAVSAIADSLIAADPKLAVNQALELLASPSEDYDSVACAMVVLQLAPDTLEGVDKSARLHALGRGYIKQGILEAGLPMVLEAKWLYKSNGEIEGMFSTTRTLLETYVKYGSHRGLRRVIEEFLSSDTWRMTPQLAQDMAQEMLDHDKLADENQTQTALIERRLETERNRNFRNIAIGGLVLMMCLIVILWQSNRLHRQYNLAKDMELEELQRKLQNMKGILEAETAASSLSSMFEVEEAKDLARFRRAFEKAHPGFIRGLHDESPRLTDSDDILIMMIIKGYSSEEVSQLLSISRASVNSARYRVRTKLGLGKSTDLKEFLLSRLG